MELILDSSALAAAQIELVTLRAWVSRPASGELNGVRMLPDRTLLDDREAISALANLPKPVHCAADVADGALAITLEPLAPEALSWHARVAQHQVEFWMQSIAREEGGIILFEGRGETITVSPDAFAEWLRDYVLPTELSLGSHKVTSEESARGVVLRVQASRGETQLTSYPLPNDSTQVCERCSARRASSTLTNHEVQPIRTVALCSECLQAELGRKLAWVLREEGASPAPDLDAMTDDDFRRLYRGFTKSFTGEDPAS